MPIVWGAKPPPRLPDSYIRLLVCKPKQRRMVARLGEITGLQTHWVKPRTIACLGEEECPYHHYPTTWKGFAPALVVSGLAEPGKCSFLKTVLVVTEEMNEDVRACAIGRIAELFRLGEEPNSPMRFEPTDRSVPVPFPPPFDVRPYVCRAMGLPYDFAGRLRLRQAE